MKRFFGLLLLCAILVAAFGSISTTAFAEQNDVKLELDVTKEGEDVVAVVTLTENDGVVDLFLRVEYDASVLELKERTFGNALAGLSPQDNFVDGEYEPPYRVEYLDFAENNTDTGRLFTLRFKVKEKAKNGNYDIKLIVRQVGARAGDSSLDPIYNPKYGDPLEATEEASSTATGGLTVAKKTVVIWGGEVDEIRTPAEKKGITPVAIGLIAGGSALFVGAVIVGYILYRKKTKQSKQ